MTYSLAVGLVLRASADVADPALLDRLDGVHANLVDQESAHPALLDSDLDATLLDERHASVDARLTVEAAGADEAVTFGVSCLRAALHAAGIATPDWAPGGAAVAATEERVEATRLPAA